MTGYVNVCYFLGNIRYRRKSQEPGAELVDVREGDIMVKRVWKAQIQQGRKEMVGKE